MSDLIAKLINLGGLLEGSKTLIGVVTAVHFLLGSFKPEWQLPFDHVLSYVGVSLLPIGLADKAVKSQQ